MVLKKYLLALAAMAATTAVQAAEMIGIRADKSKETFPIADVLSVKFQGGDVPTMDVIKTDGETSNGFRTLVFGNGEFSSVSSISSSTVSVYPNPVEDIIYVDGIDGDVEIIVMDLAGKQLLQVKARQINVSSLQTGSYLLKVNDKIVKFLKK
jgi:hypothetical protein